MPVVEAFLFGFDQRLARVAVFVEVFGEAALRAGEADEVIDFVRLRFDEEIRFLGRIALETRSSKKRRLAGIPEARHLGRMKTASVQQVPQKWPQILEWVAAGEEVEVTEQEKVIARVVPATQPDFLERAKKIWGEQPSGKPLSELVAEARGGES